jgi:tetratricopeptide (TPR) repeat protein
MLYTFLYSFVADHYQYAASIGPIALVSAGIVTLAESGKKIRDWAYTGATVIVLTLGVLTWEQCHIYLNSESIWNDTMTKNPGSLMAHFNLANELAHDRKLHEALWHYDRAVEIDPTFAEARVNRADTLVELGRPQEALADYTEALRLDPGNMIVRKQYLIFQKKLADALAAHGDPAGALARYQEIERLLPDNPESHLALGHAWLALGKPGETIREYCEAIRLDPHSALALTKLAWVLATCGDPNLRNGAEAEELARSACEITHQENPVALETLAAAYAAEGRFADAVAASLSALEIAGHSGEKPLADAIRREMQLYQNGRTLFQPASQ